MRDTPRASPTSPEAATGDEVKLAMKDAVRFTAELDHDRRREDRVARMRGFDDADHFLRLAEINFGEWVWREYRAIFQNRRMPEVPGGIG